MSEGGQPFEKLPTGGFGVPGGCVRGLKPHLTQDQFQSQSKFRFPSSLLSRGNFHFHSFQDPFLKRKNGKGINPWRITKEVSLCLARRGSGTAWDSLGQLGALGWRLLSLSKESNAGRPKAPVTLFFGHQAVPFFSTSPMVCRSHGGRSLTRGKHMAFLQEQDLAPPVPFSPLFWGRVRDPTKIDYRKKKRYPYSNLSTGGPRDSFWRNRTLFPFKGCKRSGISAPPGREGRAAPSRTVRLD